jgi:hypothetical protein
MFTARNPEANTKHPPSPPEAEDAAPVPPDKAVGPARRQFLAAAAVVALVGGLLAVGVARVKRQEGTRPKESAGVQRVAAEAGTMAVEFPAGAHPDEFRTTLLRFGEVARSEGKALDRLTADELAVTPVEPGIYVARHRYLGRPLPDSVVRITPGTPAVIRPAARDLAEAEYRLGIDTDLQGKAGVEHFRRAVKLNPDHVQAHLQLAAYELLSGSPGAVKAHLAAVRRVEPNNPEAKRVARILRQRVARSR